MLDALGLAWSCLRGEGGRRAALWLAAVLALQILPGHFQLAFVTQFSLGLFVLPQAVELLRHRSGPGWWRLLAVVGSLGAGFVLAACQMVPTLRLARLASSERDFEYLSGFAATPLHLISFVAPGLFARSPLWRGVVWDPFHTSPEEYLGYVGLVPLMLAAVAVGGWRSRPAVRALVVVALGTLWLGLGPYSPGFRLYDGWPGFSFFRAPSRWTLATSLAVCLLAAIGFDALPTLRRPQRAVLAFVGASLGATALVVLAVELAFLATDRPGWPGVASAYGRAFSALPWREPAVFEGAVRVAREPFQDLRVGQEWARQGVVLKDAPAPVLEPLRWGIYRRELAGSTLVLLTLALLAPGAGRRWFPAALLALTAVDLVAVGRNRKTDVGPIAPFASESPVLADLATLPSGTRTVDRLRNLPMLVGVAPVRSYRTLDLPALGRLTDLAGALPGRGAEVSAVREALRLTGAGVRVLDPFENRDLERGRVGVAWLGDDVVTLRDPALAGWQFGSDWVAQQGPWAQTYRVARLAGGGTRAWLLNSTPGRIAATLGPWSGDPAVVLDAMREARPLDLSRPMPERRELRVRTDGPGMIVLSELADPEWRGVWSGPNGDRPAVIDRAFGRANQGAWQAVRVPGPGSWTLRLRYDGQDVRLGLAVSTLAWAAWAWLFWRAGRGRQSSGSREGVGR